MTVKIGTTILNAIECYSYRYQNGKLVLKITVSKTEIEHDDLYNLIKNNTGDIVLTKDDETPEAYSGYGYTFTLLTTANVYTAELSCVTEAEQKIEALENSVDIQNATIQELRSLIEMQAELIEAQSDMVDTIISDILPMLDEFGEL